MKKIILTSLLVCLVALSQAQFFVGTNIGFNSTTITDKSNSNKIVITYSILESVPYLGYQINDKLSVGLACNVGFINEVRRTKYENNYEKKESASTTILMGEPFIRYQLFNHNKFSLYIHAGMGIGTTILKEDDKTQKDFEYLSYGVNIVPIIAYNFTKNFSLTMDINFLNFAWVGTSTKNKHYDNTTYINKFVLGAQTLDLQDIVYGDAMNIPYSIVSIGVVYKF